MSLFALPIMFVVRLFSSSARVFSVVLVLLVACAGVVVYGEVVERGPVHAIVGKAEEHELAYYLVQSLLVSAVAVVWLLIVLVVDLGLDRHWRVRKGAMPTVIDTLLRCVELARDEKKFMAPDVRRELVSRTHEVAVVLKHGLWRSMPVRNPLASAEFRRRCIHAGQSIEVLCVHLVLPTETTHREYLTQMVQLTDTVLSGRYGELPDHPERAAYVTRSKLATAGRITVELAVSLAPLAVYLLLRHLKLIPSAAEVPVLTLCVAWLATYGLNALGRRHPGNSQFPNVLGVFGSTK
ncbi:hypothetical protein [Lentzea sp. NPDC003310]|uniref:hypothetical protein n=1 Tax=Lentzea sp. NPDC003310 TaxID=3154447 RepID=UPI0033AE4574